MIRFRQSDAAAVPVPPANYATLFVDAATGLPAAKAADGTVISMKGTDGAPGADGAGIPAGGSDGQVLTLTDGSPGWVTPTGGVAPAGTWVNMLAAGGTLLDANDAPVTTVQSGDIMFVPKPFTFAATQPGHPNTLGTRVRVTADVIVDVVRIDPLLPAPDSRVFLAGDSGSYAVIGDGASTIALDVPFHGAYAPVAEVDGSIVDTLYLQLDTEADLSNVYAINVQITLTQFDLYLVDLDVTSVTDPLQREALVLTGSGSGGLGFDPAINPALAAATTVDVTGYYTPSPNAAPWPPAAGTEVYLGWYTIVPVGPLSLTTGNAGPGTSMWWREYTNGELPDGALLLRVSIDGGAPVLAADTYSGGV